MVRILKNDQLPGKENINAELLKYGDKNYGNKFTHQYK